MLSPYNSLKDPYLGFYFSRRRIQHHLKKSGLITEDGRILSEAAYTANLIKVDKEERMKQMMIQEIIERSVDRERKTQQIIKAKLEEIAKLEAVRNRKNEEFHRRLRMNEVFMPTIPLPSFSTLSNDRVPRRSCSAHVNGGSPKKGSIIETNSLKRQKNRKCRSANVKERDHSDVRLQHRLSQQQKPPREPPCLVKLYYHGRKHGFHGNSKGMPPMDYIKVEQQINEAASIVVFRAGVAYDTTFCFASLRKPNNRFSLTIYIDGLVYCNISSCCEFKHKKGSTIGGKNGLFTFAGVQNGAMCFLCEEARKSKKIIKRKKKAKNISANVERSLKTDLQTDKSLRKEQAIKNYEHEIANMSINSSVEQSLTTHRKEREPERESDSLKNDRNSVRSDETVKYEELAAKEVEEVPEIGSHKLSTISKGELDEESRSTENDDKPVVGTGEIQHPVNAENVESERRNSTFDVNHHVNTEMISKEIQESETPAAGNVKAEIISKAEMVESSANSDESDFSDSDDSQNYFEDSTETESTEENSDQEPRVNRQKPIS